MININDIEFYESIILWKCVTYTSIRIPIYRKDNLIYCVVLDISDTDFGKLIPVDISYIDIYQILGTYKLV